MKIIYSDEVSDAGVGNSVIARVMDGDREIGHLELVAVPQIHGMWIDPKFRGGFILSRMINGMLKKAKSLGIGLILTHGTDPQNESYLERLGFERQEWSVWKKEL